MGLNVLLATNYAIGLAFPYDTYIISPFCAYPSTDTAPSGLDLDLSFPTLWFGYLFKTQVFAAVETHGIHKFSRRHDACVESCFVGIQTCVAVSLAMLARQTAGRSVVIHRRVTARVSSASIQSIRATTPHAVLPLPALTTNAMLSTELFRVDMSRPDASNGLCEG